MTRRGRLVAIVLLFLGAGTGCSPGGEDPPPPGNAADRAFLQGILPQHKGLIASARVGARETDRTDVRVLAEQLKHREIDELDAIRATNRNVFGDGLEPSNRAYRQLGLTADAAAMDRLFTPVADDARPFDRAFLDDLLRYQQGGLRLVRAWRARSDNPEVGKLARVIVQANSEDIRRFRALRRAVAKR